MCIYFSLGNSPYFHSEISIRKNKKYTIEAHLDVMCESRGENAFNVLQIHRASCVHLNYLLFAYNSEYHYV